MNPAVRLLTVKELDTELRTKVCRLRIKMMKKPDKKRGKTINMTYFCRK